MRDPWSVLLATSFALFGVSVVAPAQEVTSGAPIVSEEVASQVPAFNYREGPESELLFKGTALAPQANGEIEVEYQSGRARIDAQVEDMPTPWSLGPYTTYVLWAVTGDGRSTSLGEILATDGDGDLETAVGLSGFALIVTAEPHFAVSVPSTAVVLVNVADDVEGTEFTVRRLTERATYQNLGRQTIDSDVPLDIYGARYALAISAAADVEKYAPDAYAQARDAVVEAERALASDKRSERREAPQLARRAIQSSEDARRAAIQGRQNAEAEAAKLAAATAAAAAAAQAARASAAEQSVAEAQSDVARIRSELRERLNEVLPTRETPRGLVAELAGVQFAVGKATLNPSARQSLSKFSGILLAYPGLKLNVEGHTDSTGSLETNQRLSLQRAISVRDYLIAEGIPASSMDVAGYGPSQPVADNSTADGRERNRRVEIIVSSGPLGTR